MKFQQRTVRITEGTSGMGLEWTRELLERGNTLIDTGRDQDKLEATEGSLPGVHTFISDASDPQAVAYLRDAVVVRFPGLYTLINSAGVYVACASAQRGGGRSKLYDKPSATC